MKAIRHKATGKWVRFREDLDQYELIDSDCYCFTPTQPVEETIQNICDWADQFNPDDFEAIDVLIIEKKKVTEDVMIEINPYSFQSNYDPLIWSQGFRAALDYLGLKVEEV